MPGARAELRIILCGAGGGQYLRGKGGNDVSDAREDSVFRGMMLSRYHGGEEETFPRRLSWEFQGRGG